MADTHLTKAILKTAGGEHIEVQGYFNPTQYVQNKAAAPPHQHTEGDAPTLEFNAGEPMVMNVELMFDCVESGGDVKDLYVSKIQKMAHISDGEKHPPLVLFCWGSPQQVFRGVITKMHATYNMFSAAGIPTGATVGISFRRA